MDNSDNFTLNLSRETEHFRFHYTDVDTNCINDLSHALESNYERISKDLESYLTNRVEVKIYPNLDSFHEFGWGKKDSPKWLVGCANYGDIRVVSPLNPGPIHSYNSIQKTIVHEFTHILIENIRQTGVPRWLHEGVAGYEARQMYEYRRRFLCERIRSDQIPTIEEIRANFAESGGYEFSYTIVEFIVQKLGISVLVEIIKNPDNLEKLVEMAFDEFLEKWREFLKENYA